MSMSLPHTNMQPQNLPMQDNNLPPHGLKDIIPYRMTWDEILPTVLVILGAVLLIGALIYFLRKKFWKKKQKVVIPEDPFLVLERKLSLMQPPEPFEGKKSIQYFFDLNMLFREFIELSSGVPATDLTLKELREPLRLKSKLSRETTEEVLRFLERTENIKFAGSSTDLIEAKESYRQVMEWVSYLKPKQQIQEGVEK